MSANEAAVAKSRRTRSPNYPAISLTDALPRIGQIYDREFTHAATSDTIARAMGYNGSNGASDTIISALKKYGLLENAGHREYKLSERAVDIHLHKKGEAERAKAIRDAAFAPPLFAEFYGEYGEVLPSEDNLRVKLVKKGFNPKSVSDVIHAYRDTLELVSQEEAAYTGADAGKPKGESKPAGETPMQQPSTPPAITPRSPTPPSSLVQFYNLDGTPAIPAKTTELAFKLSRGSEARVVIYGEASQEAIEKLTTLLDLQKDTFPTKAELAAAEPPETESDDAQVKGAA